MGELSEWEEVLDFVRGLYETKLHDEFRMCLIKSVQLLTPTRKGPLGVAALNLELQRIVQRKLYGVDVPPVPEGRRPPLLAGDKIIQRRNNYDIEVMNGCVGQVVSVDRTTGDVTARFDDREVVLKRSEGHLADVDLAYALTIHQTRGSEFDMVIVIVHKSHAYQHHRNLLYTAATRAKYSTVIVGDHWGIRNCAARVLVNNRRTWLPLHIGPNDRGSTP
jgi:exodeoxyribonuclease V alpha subunit